MEPSITWLDLTAADQTRMRRVLDLFGEQGTVDELGLGTLRDSLSDALFPGTSSIQTRLRYVLFVPWVYQRLERQRVRSTDVSRRAREAELALIAPLSASHDNDGVIGGRARSTLKRLPSAVYWSALVRWGLFVPEQSQSWYHRHFGALHRRRDDLPRADDPGVTWARQPSWNPRLSAAPDDFPSTVSFALTSAEAAFLRDQITSRCAGSLLAWLAASGSAPTGAFWDEPAVSEAPGGIQRTVELARRFSLHMEGAPLVYNLAIARARHTRFREAVDIDRVEQYRGRLSEWAAREAGGALFDPGPLWAFVAARGARLANPQRRFVEAWAGRVSEIGAAAIADDEFVADLVRSREIALKTSRSRFTNSGRLRDWRGEAGVGRMSFRWSRVRQLLTDLHVGLEA